MVACSKSRSTEAVPSRLQNFQRITPKLGFYLTLKLAQDKSTSRCSEGGLTLIEGLIAIVIVSITVISITPPIFWATASRVQTRRAEQALQLAQGEIDRVRTLIERDTARLEDLPPNSNLDEASVRNRGQVPAPQAAKSGNIVTGSRDCQTGNSLSTSTNEYVQIDTNADCEADFLVQAFRSRGLNSNGDAVGPNEIPAAFVMGVRVYAAVAKEELNAGRGKEEQASLVGTKGLGYQKQQPLAVLYSTIVPSNKSSNLDLYRKLCTPASGGLQDARKC